jgi:hypothetical protein
MSNSKLSNEWLIDQCIISMFLDESNYSIISDARILAKHHKVKKAEIEKWVDLHIRLKTQIDFVARTILQRFLDLGITMEEPEKDLVKLILVQFKK